MRARAVEKNFQLYNKLFSFMAPNPGTRGFSRKYDGDVLRSADMSSAETLIEPESPKNEAFLETLLIVALKWFSRYVN